MLRAVILLAVVASAAAAPTGIVSESAYEEMWQSFVQEHNKVYHPHEVLMRFSVFKDNLAFIQDHNENHAEKLGYTVAINQFADMTNAEFKRTMTGLNAKQNKAQDNVEILPAATSDSVDWVSKGAVTPVKNQGQCGSCWAFSTTGSVEGANFIASGKLLSFSEQELVDCAQSYGNQGCNGGLMDDGFKYIEAKGDVLEATYPYTGKTGTCSSSKSANPSVKVVGFKDVQQNSEAQLMAAVEKAPVSVAIEADQSGFQFYKTGVFSGTCGTKLDHGVLVVGYGTDGGKAYWKVKNSWGPTWGSSGYIMLAKDISSASGQCGIAMQPSYPTMGPPGPPSPPTPPTPTPPTPPTPPPTPGHSHYGNPSDGCLSDEEAVRVTGVAGSFCSPDCKSAACPTDVPSGVAAKPQCALQTTGGDKKCALICSPTTDWASLRAGDAQCGEATCQPIQGVGLCTYGAGPPPPTPPPPTPTPPSPSQTHYGNPTDGCESDEEAVRVTGVPGSFCAPDCKSAACPTDVPSGVAAKPQCALKTTGGDKKCALICSPTTDEASLRAGDAQCGAATCQPIQSVGLCTYGAGPSPPSPSPSPSPPGPSGECTIATGLECAEDLEKCIGDCKEGIGQCVACLGESFATCCPCLKKVDPNLPISCGRRSARPEFMEVQTKFLMTVETKFVN